MAVNADGNISLYRGDSKTLEVAVTDKNGGPVDITGASLLFSAKEKLSDTAYVIQKDSVNAVEILITDAAGGVFQVYLIPADTQTQDIGLYYYDIQLTTSAGKVYTIKQATIKLLEDVTRP